MLRRCAASEPSRQLLENVNREQVNKPEGLKTEDLKTSSLCRTTNISISTVGIMISIG